MNITRRTIHHTWQCQKHNFFNVPESSILMQKRNVSKVISKKAVSVNERRDFVAVFPDVVRDLTEINSHSDITESQKWFAKVLQYNARDGKMNRGLAVTVSHKLINGQQNLTPESINKSHILGWCVELLQSYFLVADDMMDKSETRRGKKCWYLMDDVKEGAINDAITINAGIYKLLHKHFRKEPFYINILELFHDVTLKTSLGQTLDLKTASGNRPNLSKFVMDRYNSIAKYKTAYYSFYLPVMLAMHMNSITDKELQRQARTILLEMGIFFQIQDDFLDCFGDPSVTGKVGTDIAEGKCSWLAVVALQRSNAKQRQIMEKNYGLNDPEAVAIITQLYKDLGLPATFLSYEETTSSLIRRHIHQISQGINHKVFFKLLDAIERRKS